eukprot:CAMPEP_0184513256 /NCGR_PEP_ID=MMETSP0198_2-20121128/3326_1 /TAXON_ID=1112570 /ORGANISM="Thraustochytrium sp., Strain LLF1b" /LENGTH=249 /DNA_ID=CAMNT_0026903353 /DNA_START=132 /DNA_END=878 /DNA_ORIENTATION=-
MKVTREGLKITRIANCDVYVGAGIKTPWGRLFGGQTVAQSLHAACDTVPDNFPVHSLHTYFILAGDSEKEILFEVERTRDGGSFKTRATVAKQDNKTICHTHSSFHKQEYGLSYQVNMLDLLKSKGLNGLPNPREFANKPNEDVSDSILRHTVAQGKDWKVSYVKTASEGLIQKGNWKENCSMLTFISDTGMVNAMRLPHGEKPWSLSVSLDHMIHFHRPLDILVEEWMVLIYETRVSTAARGLSQCLC